MFNELLLSGENVEGTFKKELFCLYLYVCEFIHVYRGTHRCQKSMPGPSELELQVIVNLLIWVLGIVQ